MAKFLCFAARSKNALKIIIITLSVLYFYHEFITYWVLPKTWIVPPNCPRSQCKKLLLVSDPQIIGPEWKNILLFDALAIWDSDRYIKRTFKEAVNFMKPDVIIFLGDLIDQGHSATDPEFQSYVDRLNLVFELPESSKNATVIIIPGDNDVGGVDDVLVLANVHRFDVTFNQTEDCVLAEEIEFCKANLMTSVMQESKFITSSTIRVALSHVPLVPKQSFFLKEVVKKIRPHLIFSGHLHKSSHYTVYEDDVWDYKHSSITDQETRYKTYKFHEGFIHEIVVPTCSYRMGVYKMGFGAAYIDIKKELVYYNVLWLPHRFRQVAIYLVTLIPLILSLTVIAWKKLMKGIKIDSRRNKLYSSYA